MTTKTIKLLAVTVAIVMALSMAGPVAGMAMTEGQPTGDVSLNEGTFAGTSGDDVTDQDVELDTTPAELSPEVRSMSGESEVILRLPDADTSEASADHAAMQSHLKGHAQMTQGPALDRLESMQGVEVRNTFWIANAIAVTVNFDRVNLQELRTLPGVERLHKQHTYQLPEPRMSTDIETTEDDYTYGLEQINAPEVWDELGVQGEGARIAVLDTGIDVDHEDLDLFTDDPDDPTYPGGWMDFDDDGNQVDSEPHDEQGHGTHVSGTVAGGDSSGTSIGVAPEVDLMHGKALDDGGGGTFERIIASMEWAVEEDADVLSMSLGADGFHADMIEPVQNARAAGAVVVSSSGNSGEGTTGSPGNVYEAFAIGASNEQEDIASFSSGEIVESDSDWGDDADEDWPDEYVVPDVSAPGVDVNSASTGGGYEEMSGTSMAAPHVSGVIGLMLSANPDLEPDDIEPVLEETAWKPDDADEGDEIDGQDTRYGHGIVDAYEATSFVALDSGISGTVTDAEDGSAIEGATVDADEGGATETDAAGEYDIILDEGTYDVTADAFGYEPDTETVTIDNEGHEETVNFDLDPTLETELVASQPDGIEGGDQLSATLEVINADDISVSLAGDYDPPELDLTIDGQSADFEEDVSVSDGEVDIEVDTPADTSGIISLEATASGASDSEATDLGETEVFGTLIRLGVVDDAGAHGDAVVDVLEDQLADVYEIETTTSDDHNHDAYVVQNLDADNAVDFVAATEDADTGVVYLDQWGDDSEGIPPYTETTDDIQDAHEGFDGEVPIQFSVEQEHEILEGHDVDDSIEIHEADYPDHTWFDLAESSSFEALASVDNNEETKGTSLAIDDETSTVLASSLGMTTFVGPDDYMDEATEILGSTVEHVAPDDEEDDPEPAEFAVEITDTNDPVEEGEDLDVTAEVTNEGDEQDEQTITLDVDGDVVDSDTVALDGGADDEVTLTWETEPGDDGTHTAEVASDDDEDSTTVQVDAEDDDPAEEGHVSLGEAWGEVGETVAIEFETDADDVAAYEAELVYNESVVEFDGIDAVDIGDDEPVYNDNESGVLTFTDAQETGVDAPTIAEISFEIVGDEGDETSISFVEDETAMNTPDDYIEINEYVDGIVGVEGVCATAGGTGDVNDDGNIGSLDATLTLQHIAGHELEEFHEDCADLTGDGEVTTGDVTQIQQIIVGIEDPPEE